MRDPLRQAYESQEIRYRPAQPSSRHTSTTSISRRPAAGCLQQFLTSFSLCRAGANLANLHGDYPATTGGILPRGAILHRKSLLVIGGHSSIQAGPQHFRLFA
jgi:hypothetical protein